MTQVHLLRMTWLHARSILNATIDCRCLRMGRLLGLLKWCFRDIGNVTRRATLHLSRRLGPRGSGRAGSLGLVLVLWRWVPACILQATLVGRHACRCAKLAMLPSRQHIDSQDLTSIWPIKVGCRRPTFLLLASCVWIQISALDIVTSGWSSPSIWTSVKSTFRANSLPCSTFTTSMCVCVTLVGQSSMTVGGRAREWPIVWGGLLRLGLMTDVTCHCCVWTLMIGATSLIHRMMMAAVESIFRGMSCSIVSRWGASALCRVKSSGGLSRLKLCHGLGLRSFCVLGWWGDTTCCCVRFATRTRFGSGRRLLSRLCRDLRAHIGHLIEMIVRAAVQLDVRLLLSHWLVLSKVSLIQILDHLLLSDWSVLRVVDGSGLGGLARAWVSLVELVKVSFFRVFMQEIWAVMLSSVFLSLIIWFLGLGAILQLLCINGAFVISATIVHGRRRLRCQITCDVVFVIDGILAKLWLSLLAGPTITDSRSTLGLCLLGCKVLGKDMRSCRVVASRRWLVMTIRCLITVHLKLLTFECCFLIFKLRWFSKTITLSTWWKYIFSTSFCRLLPWEVLSASIFNVRIQWVLSARLAWVSIKRMINILNCSIDPCSVVSWLFSLVINNIGLYSALAQTRPSLFSAIITIFAFFWADKRWFRNSLQVDPLSGDASILHVSCLNDAISFTVVGTLLLVWPRLLLSSFE